MYHPEKSVSPNPIIRLIMDFRYNVKKTSTKVKIEIINDGSDDAKSDTPKHLYDSAVNNITGNLNVK
jgi:hypothetical protein